MEVRTNISASVMSISINVKPRLAAVLGGIGFMGVL